MICSDCNDFPRFFDIPVLAEAACDAIAPAWPLDRSIAVNPYWGYRHKSFQQTMEEMAFIAGSPMAMPPSYYKQKYLSGTISERSLEMAIQESGMRFTPENLIRFLDSTPVPFKQIPLLSDAVDASRELTHAYSWREHILTQVSQCCASYFDRFQAEWPVPDNTALYLYWLEMLSEDRGTEFLMRRPNLRQACRTLPSEPLQLLEVAANRLNLSPDQFPLFLSTAMHRIPGWASHCAYTTWQAKLAGLPDPGHPINLLAIRVAWELLLDDGDRSANSIWALWQVAWQETVNSKPPEHLQQAAIWQRAEELTYQQSLLSVLSTSPLPQNAVPSAQAVFCLDVRSEPVRRAIESISPAVQTLGYAGFFGMPIEFQPLGSHTALPHLPGLLRAEFTATETTGDQECDQRIAAMRGQQIWLSDELSRMPASGFTLVETVGIGKAINLWERAFPSSRTRKSDASGHSESANNHKIRINATLKQKADLAERFLRATGLHIRIAPVLILVGHSGQTSNNPTAAALNCGACCGQNGILNARVLRDILADPQVQIELRKRGIRFPEDMKFVAALHNTTLETITMDEADSAQLSADLQNWIEKVFESAGNQTRLERLRNEGFTEIQPKDSTLAAQALERSRNWAETRPEWGLANNAAMVIGPRSLTRGLNLEGRCFLHEYNADQDRDGSLLEQIMTAPMIVANWINMQYFGSTVDPARFGAGNKTLHNVVGGAIGLFEGNSGDLRQGLSLQSVYDGTRWRHSPLRLTVILYATREHIQAALQRNLTVRELVEGNWVELIRVADGDFEKFEHSAWIPVDATPQQLHESETKNVPYQ